MTVGERRVLVVVSGAAASGKTSLARRLARELRLPLLSRDVLKEALMDSLGSPSRARSRELGVASYALLYTVLDELLAARIGAVVESNFSRGLAEAELRGRAASGTRGTTTATTRRWPTSKPASRAGATSRSPSASR